MREREPTLESKRHAACDDCRSRKLKCSGELEGCTRCRRDSLSCSYSLRKPMGRPRKRQRTGDLISGAGNYKIAKTPSLQLDASQEIAGWSESPFQPTIFDSSEMSTTLDPSSTTARDYQASYELEIPFEGSYDYGLDLNLASPLISPSALSFENSTLVNESLDTTLDSSNARIPDSCSCLFSLSSALSGLQQSFQDDRASLRSLSLLRSSFESAKSAFLCLRCSTVMTLGFQTQMILGTLLPLVVEGYRRILESIENEIVGLDSIGEPKMVAPEEKKDFGLEHQEPAFLSFSTVEYRERALELLRCDVLGIGKPDKLDSIAGLVAIMEHRQREKHNHYEKCVGLKATHGRHASQEPLCLRIIEHTSHMIQNLGLQHDCAGLMMDYKKSEPIAPKYNGTGPMWGRISFFRPILDKITAWT